MIQPDKSVKANPTSDGVSQMAFKDIDLLDLDAKPGYLELFTKTGLNRILVITPLMMVIFTTIL